MIVYVVTASVASIECEISYLALGLLCVGVILRFIGLHALKLNFSYSAKKQNKLEVVKTGIYRFHRNPLLLGYWLELAAFTSVLPWPPLARLMLMAVFGLLCAWHAHEDNNQFSNGSSEYRRYLEDTGNGILSLFFPEKARVVDTRHLQLDTFGAYSFVAALTAQIIALGYGIGFDLFLWVLPGVFFGAAIYWKLTVKTTLQKIGFSFYGGLIGGVFLASLYFVVTKSFSSEILATMSIALVVGHAIGRLGCVGHGCCTGEAQREYAPFYIKYRDPLQRINRACGNTSSFCYPTVLIEALGQFVIAVFCILWMEYAPGIWLVGYGALRVIIQSLRIESGDITRILPSIVLMTSGCFAFAYLPPAQLGAWHSPAPYQIGIATIIAASMAMGYGFRIKGQSASTEEHDTVRSFIVEPENHATAEDGII